MAIRELPWSDTCFVCGEANAVGLGVRFTADDNGVRVETVPGPQFEGFPGHLHGGVITALLDEAIGWACSVATHRLYYTVELTVRFKRPVPAGRTVVVRGMAGELGGRLARGSGWIEDRNGTRLATADGVYFPLPEDEQRAVVPMLKMPGRPAAAEDI